jgi:hypothetical protein
MWPKGTRIISREGGEEGYTSGGTRHCRLEGCSGLRLRTIWKDGKHTWPCTKGLMWNEEKQGWQIM